MFTNVNEWSQMLKMIINVIKYNVNKFYPMLTNFSKY